MKPMVDPKRDLAGATPEKLARALLRPLRTLGDGSGPRARVETVVGNERPVEKVLPDKPRSGVPLSRDHNMLWSAVSRA